MGYRYKTTVWCYYQAEFSTSFSLSTVLIYRMHTTFKSIALALIATITTTVCSASMTKVCMIFLVLSYLFTQFLQGTRETNTCADTSLARVIYQGYNSAFVKHVLNFHSHFVSANTGQGTADAAFWNLQGPVFKAWPTQQPFTAPLFRLESSSKDDFLFALGTDAQTPPKVSGFGSAFLTAWVYNASDCGGVPLMSAVMTAQTDHYYTTDPDEHAGLLADGWTDAGVVAFVLPLPTF